MVKNFKLYVERIHTLEEDKRFQCQDCGKGFIKKAALEVHKMNVHNQILSRLLQNEQDFYVKEGFGVRKTSSVRSQVAQYIFSLYDFDL